MTTSTSKCYNTNFVHAINYLYLSYLAYPPRSFGLKPLKLLFKAGRKEEMTLQKSGLLEMRKITDPYP